MDFLSVTGVLLGGFLTTLKIFALTLVFALPLGLLICLGLMSRHKIVSAPCSLLVWIVRGTPLMLQLIAFFYIPGILGFTVWGGGEFGRTAATVTAFSLNYACYFAVIYKGDIVEIAETDELFNYPLHPYTQSLLAVVPRLRVGEHSTELVLEGDVPSAINPPTGCPFHTRCSHCMDICTKQKPKPQEKEPGHFVACHLADKEA